MVAAPQPNPAKPKPNRNAIHRRGAEIAEISAEKTKNKLNGRGGLCADPGGAQREQRARRKYSASSGKNSTREVLTLDDVDVAVLIGEAHLAAAAGDFPVDRIRCKGAAHRHFLLGVNPPE
jgi:hypothetical protein